MRTIGIIGAGEVGSQLARAAVTHGYQVVIANSRGPETLTRLAGRTVTLKVRFASFRTITRSQTVPDPIDTGPGIAAVAGELLRLVDVEEGVRLLGVSLSSLGSPPAQQLGLGLALGDASQDGGHDGWHDASHAVDEIRQRFGHEAIGPAALVDRAGDADQSCLAPGDLSSAHCPCTAGAREPDGYE